MPRKKKEETIKPVGDPFFDLPTEEYWKQPTINGLPTNMPEFLEAYDTKMEEEAKDIENLNVLLIPLPQLRMRLAELQTMGATKIPLGALLLEIKKVWEQSIISDE